MGAEVERRACVTTNTLVAPAFAPPDDDRFLPPTTTSINPVQFQFSTLRPGDGRIQCERTTSRPVTIRRTYSKSRTTAMSQFSRYGTTRAPPIPTADGTTHPTLGVLTLDPSSRGNPSSNNTRSRRRLSFRWMTTDLRHSDEAVRQTSSLAPTHRCTASGEADQLRHLLTQFGV